MGCFQRETEVLASLNHPNIAGIQGLEREGEAHAIAMELRKLPPQESSTQRDLVNTLSLLCRLLNSPRIVGATSR